jgi:hypothetical protein
MESRNQRTFGEPAPHANARSQPIGKMMTNLPDYKSHFEEPDRAHSYLSATPPSCCWPDRVVAALDTFADHVLSAGKMAGPEGTTENRHLISPSFLFFRQEDAADDGTGAEHRKEAR